MRVSVNISKVKLPAFLEHVKGFKGARVIDEVEENLTGSVPRHVLPSILASLKEIEAYQRGEIELQSARDFLNEL